MENPKSVVNFSEGISWKVVLIPLCFLVVYILSASGYCGFHDALGFLYDAKYQFAFTTNATNHFLYNAVLHLLVQTLPMIDPVLILTGVSVLFSVFTLWLMFHVLNSLGYSYSIAAICTLALGFSFTYWQQSSSIEVYAFNNFFFLLFISWILKDRETNTQRRILLVVLIAGIAMLIHIQHILALPGLMFYFFSGSSKANKKLLAVVFFLGVSSFLFVPPVFLKKHAVSAIFF